MVIDCENLSFNLTSTNGPLRVKNLAADSVARLSGSVSLWSGLWSNTVQVVLTNNWDVTYDTNGTFVSATNAPITNIFGVSYYALMVDASGLRTTAPVTVYDLISHNPDVVIDDNMRIVQSLYLDATNLTINGDVTLTGSSLANLFGPAGFVSIPNWTYTNAPNLLYFTNNNSLSLSVAPGEAHFGDDRTNGYLAFVNNGLLSASTISIKSSFVGNSGTLASTGPMFLNATAAKFDGGGASITGVGWFRCGTLRMNDFQLSARGQVYFSVTNALFDAGPLSSNVLSFQNGFSLLSKPSVGDLLGTTFNSEASGAANPISVKVDHFWPGNDMGATAAGYSDNEAIGKLILSSQVPFPTFTFGGGSTGAHAMYVDLLDLSALGTNFESFLKIDPNYTIYYAAAKLAFTPPPDTNGVPQEPEEYLDDRLGGRLRWASSYAGPNSSTPVVINTNGQSFSIEINTALRNSRRIDTDGDGIPNYYDPNPVDPPPFKLTSELVSVDPAPAKAISISWMADPNTAYQVQFTTNPVSATVWQSLLNVTNNSSTNRTLVIWDTNSVPVSRFYRVKVNP